MTCRTAKQHPSAHGLHALQYAMQQWLLTSFLLEPPKEILLPRTQPHTLSWMKIIISISITQFLYRHILPSKKSPSESRIHMDNSSDVWTSAVEAQLAIRRHVKPRRNAWSRALAFSMTACLGNDRDKHHRRIDGRRRCSMGEIWRLRAKNLWRRRSSRRSLRMRL